VSKAVNFFPTVAVPAVTVDEILADQGWDQVDFIKIDIEGSEIAALKGMKGLLNRPDAPPIFVESNGHTLNFFDHTPAHLKSALEGFGYRNYLVEPDSLVPVQVKDLQPFTCVDLLAVQRTPAGFRTFRIDPPLPRSEMISRIVHSSHLGNPDERRYIARALQTTERSILADEQVIEAVALLRNDTDLTIREAAAAVCLHPLNKRKWFFWRRS
jgi:hypothetical protein